MGADHLGRLVRTEDRNQWRTEALTGHISQAYSFIKNQPGARVKEMHSSDLDANPMTTDFEQHLKLYQDKPGRPRQEPGQVVDMPGWNYTISDKPDDNNIRSISKNFKRRTCAPDG